MDSMVMWGTIEVTGKDRLLCTRAPNCSKLDADNGADNDADGDAAVFKDSLICLRFSRNTR
jgi:hypothetical protein